MQRIQGIIASHALHNRFTTGSPLALQKSLGSMAAGGVSSQWRPNPFLELQHQLHVHPTVLHKHNLDAASLASDVKSLGSRCEVSSLYSPFEDLEPLVRC